MSSRNMRNKQAGLAVPKYSVRLVGLSHQVCMTQAKMSTTIRSTSTRPFLSRGL
jgi:hypothetical protein